MALLSLHITSSAQSFYTERRFPSDSTVRDLKNKLELLVGIPADSMQIELRDKNNKPIKVLGDNAATLAMCDVQDSNVLHVTSTGGAQPFGVDSGGNVQKFELTDDEYAKRHGTVRDFLQKHQVGSYDPDASKKREEKEKQLIEESVTLAAAIPVNARCEVRVAGQPTKRGTVLFVGPAHVKPGHWIGIRLDEPLGKNNGTVDGKKYFECPEGYGLLVRPQNVVVGDFPEEGFGSEDNMDEI